MADLLLIYPPEKKPAALQLAGALEAAGYAPKLEAASASEGERIVALARSASACLLVWSRSTASAAAIDGWLAPLRQLPGLIEVTTDGIAPHAADESRIVLLSGWRGQPFHQGWQRIVKRLEALAPPAKPPSAKPAAPVRAEGKQPGTRHGAKLGLGAAAALTLAAAVGATAWVGTRTPDPQPVPQALTPVPIPAPSPVTEPLPPAPTISPVQEADAEASPAPLSKPAASKPKPARPTLKKPHAATPLPALKRYTKRGAKTMRRFCAAAGRNTPECRTFARSQAARR